MKNKKLKLQCVDCSDLEKIVNHIFDQIEGVIPCKSCKYHSYFRQKLDQIKDDTQTDIYNGSQEDSNKELFDGTKVDKFEWEG